MMQIGNREEWVCVLGVGGACFSSSRSDWRLYVLFDCKIDAQSIHCAKKNKLLTGIVPVCFF